MPCAAGGAVDQRQRPAAVHPSQGVEQMRPRIGLEHGSAVANLDEPEAECLRDRRRRNCAVDQGLHYLPAGHAGNLLGLCDAVGERPSRA